MGDLCEVILAHGLLFDGERTVVGGHHIQSIAAGKRHKAWRSSPQESEETLLDSNRFLTFPASS